jgi:hypothetical protein
LSASETFTAIDLHCLQLTTTLPLPNNDQAERAARRGMKWAYMDAPQLPSLVSGSELQVEIAAIHSAFVCDSWSLALME